jgi:hypothetical protein
MAEGNLTGGQIQTILDTFTYKAIEPIVYRSRVFDAQLVHLLSVTTRNRKRKLSSIGRDQAISLLSKALVEQDPVLKLEYIRQAKIERGFLHAFASKFVQYLKEFKQSYWEYLTAKGPEQKRRKQQLQAVARDVGFKDFEVLYSSLETVEEYLTLTYAYRNQIISSYLKHAYKQAKSYVNSNPFSSFDVQEVGQNFLVAVTKAIDKYDSSKGALTSYVNWWILNAQTCGAANHEYGIAFSVPQGVKKDMALGNNSIVNFSVSMNTGLSAEDDEGPSCIDIRDDVDGERQLLQQESDDMIQYLVKCADDNAIVRLYLDIGEYFSESEKQRMRRHMAFEQSKQPTRHVRNRKRNKTCQKVSQTSNRKHQRVKRG